MRQKTIGPGVAADCAQMAVAGQQVALHDAIVCAVDPHATQHLITVGPGWVRLDDRRVMEFMG